MDNPLRSYPEYAQFVYKLLTDRVTVASHTVTVYTTSQTVGLTRGAIVFRSGHILRIFEHIDFIAQRLLKYAYELEYQGERLWWYDPMPHPDVPELAHTHPHHKHVPPEMKHHRVPAPGLSFTQPNLPQLLQEVEAISDQ